MRSQIKNPFELAKALVCVAPFSNLGVSRKNTDPQSLIITLPSSVDAVKDGATKNEASPFSSPSSSAQLGRPRLTSSICVVASLLSEAVLLSYR